MQDFLQLSPSYPDLLALKSVRRTLEAMQQNEKFMSAIEEDLMAEAEDEEAEFAEQEALRRI